MAQHWNRDVFCTQHLCCCGSQSKHVSDLAYVSVHPITFVIGGSDLRLGYHSSAGRVGRVDRARQHHRRGSVCAANCGLRAAAVHVDDNEHRVELQQFQVPPISYYPISCYPIAGQTRFRQPRRLFGPTILDFHQGVFWYPIIFGFYLIVLEK